MEVKNRIAAVVLPTLKAMNERPKSTFAKHHFVYALHWSDAMLSIFAHFAYDNERIGKVSFCQVLLAQHWMIGTRSRRENYFPNRNKDKLLGHWRIVVALLTVAEQVCILEQDILKQQATKALVMPLNAPAPNVLLQR